MAVPTIEQICCIVGANTPCRHSYAGGGLPTVNCRSSGTCQWYSPTRQWHTQPSPNPSPEHIPCSTPKEMLRMAHKTAFGRLQGTAGSPTSAALTKALNCEEYYTAISPVLQVKDTLQDRVCFIPPRTIHPKSYQVLCKWPCRD